MFKAITIWWLRHRIKRRLTHIAEIKLNLASHTNYDGDAQIYLLELRDRNRIDESRIAALDVAERRAA